MNIFLARQAIYDRRENIVAYELLYRNSKINKFAGDLSDDDATIKLISNTATIGLEQLTNKKTAFINFSEGILLEDIITLLHKDAVVIEVLESVNPTEEVINYLKDIKKRGYTLALDDVVFNSKYREFGDLIDIYKIDFMQTTKTQRRLLLEILSGFNPSAKFLAEKIETDEDLVEAVEYKYDYYQGFYFSKPLMILAKDLLITNTGAFSLMAELHKSSIDMDNIEEIMKSDITLTYKLIKFLNSSVFSFVQSINSVRQAIMLIGSSELKKWVSLIIIRGMKGDNDGDATNNIIIRSRFCELIAGYVSPKKKSLAFLTGLFSNLDSFTGRSMDEICDEMPIDLEIKDALLGKENELKLILDLVKAYEEINCTAVESYCNKLGIEENNLVDYYIKSLDWAGEALENIN